MNDPLRLTGIFRLILRGPDGQIKAERTVRNLVVNTGRARVIDLLDGTGNIPEYIAIGDDGTAAAAAQTALVGSELARSTQITPTQPDAYTLRLTHTFAAGTGTGTIAEAGVFCDAASGTMMARAVISPSVPKGAGDSLQVQYDLTYAAG